MRDVSQELREDSIRRYYLFKATWEKMFSEGKCPSWDGAECRRVIVEWMNLHCPVIGLESFIYQASNRPPTNLVSR